MENGPLISIIIAVYNAEKYLPECLQSLTKQTYQNIEILCINDGSQDHSLDILNQWAKKNSRIKVFSQQNSGAGTARNIGLKNVTGQYIMFCDADDFYQPTMCEEMLQSIIENNVDFAMCDTNIIEQDKRHGRKISDINYHYLNFKEKIFLTPWLKNKINVVIWNKIFKTELIKKYNIKFLDKHKCEDNAFMWQYLCVSQTMFGLDKKLYNYRLLSNSIMGSFFTKGDIYLSFDQLLAIKNVFDFINKNGLENNIPWLLLKTENGIYFYMSYMSYKKSLEYLNLLNNEILKKLNPEILKNFHLLSLCIQEKYDDIINKVKNSNKENKTKFSIFEKVIINNTKKIYILGIPVFKRKKTETNKKYYLLGIKIISIKNNKNLIDIKEIKIPEEQKYITCFDCLYDTNQEAIDAYTFFCYLQAHHIPSKYIILKENSLKNTINNKDIIVVKDFKDFLYNNQNIIAQSKMILTSFGFSGSYFDKYLKALPYLQYIFIEHGVTLLNKSVLSIYGSDNFNKILVPSHLTYDLYKKRNLWSEKQMLCCGLPRWDNLNKETKAEGIFVFFTWRRTFKENSALVKEHLDYICQFLINLKKITQNKCTIKIAWHHELTHNNLILPQLDNSNIEFISTDKISDAIKNSQMLITDYSSVSWDFLYQNKPVIYYRFSRDNIFLNETDQRICLGAMQEDDKFYNCLYNEKEVLDKVKYYIEHNFELEFQNKKITDNIFWNRENNCEKLYKLLTDK